MTNVFCYPDLLDEKAQHRLRVFNRVCGDRGPLMPPTRTGENPVLRWPETIPFEVSPSGVPVYPVLSACRMSWDVLDVERFLSKCLWSFGGDGMWCILYTGARSRGKGNKQWYGTFWTKGKSVRAHKFMSVAVFGERPSPDGIDEIDHLCFNTRCVGCLEVVPREINQRRIRRYGYD